MYMSIIAWAGLAMLLILFLPITVLQKLLLGVYGWTLRLTMLALIAGAAYLWFRPAQVPIEVSNALGYFPWARSVLPQPGTPAFGIGAVGLVSLVALPLLAMIDLCRRSVVRRIEHVTRIVDEAAPPAPRIESVPPPAPQATSKVPSRFGRRAAADAMAQAGSTSGVRTVR